MSSEAERYARHDKIKTDAFARHHDEREFVDEKRRIERGKAMKREAKLAAKLERQRRSA